MKSCMPSVDLEENFRYKQKASMYFLVTLIWNEYDRYGLSGKQDFNGGMLFSCTPVYLSGVEMKNNEFLKRVTAGFRSVRHNMSTFL